VYTESAKWSSIYECPRGPWSTLLNTQLSVAWFDYCDCFRISDKIITGRRQASTECALTILSLENQQVASTFLKMVQRFNHKADLCMGSFVFVFQDRKLRLLGTGTKFEHGLQKAHLVLAPEHLGCSRIDWTVQLSSTGSLFNYNEHLNPWSWNKRCALWPPRFSTVCTRPLTTQVLDNIRISSKVRHVIAPQILTTLTTTVIIQSSLYWFNYYENIRECNMGPIVPWW
jgi:hypothetical protein